MVIFYEGCRIIKLNERVCFDRDAFSRHDGDDENRHEKKKSCNCDGGREDRLNISIRKGTEAPGLGIPLCNLGKWQINCIYSISKRLNDFSFSLGSCEVISYLLHSESGGS